MKWLFVFMILFSTDILAENSFYFANPYSSYFKESYKSHPDIPKGLLESIAYTKTRITHLKPSSETQSCVGLPAAYGVMGLIKDGKGYFKNTLELVSLRSGYDQQAIIESPETSIKAFADAFSTIKNELGITSSDISSNLPVIIYMNELPLATEGQRFAMDCDIYGILTLLTKKDFMDKIGQKIPEIDLLDVFGEENLKVLSAGKINLTEKKISANGSSYASKIFKKVCLDYPLAIWNPADPSNYSSRSGTAISAVTVHDIEGSYAGAISWFQNPNANVSAHYVLRSIDGQITQMVCESDKAWHVGTENPYTIGLEHEGFAGQPGWYTEAMYKTSAALVKDICTDNGINPLRTHDGPACSGGSSSCQLGGCIKVKGHQNYPNQTHTDPGIYWDWEHYYRLINDNTLITSYTASSGSFYDSGGSGSNYSNDERKIWIISPTGATSATLTFSSFGLEADWDYLYIYDGTSSDDPQIGIYTGNNSPGTITAQSGSFFIEFRSDCATTASGWEASWTSGTSVLPCDNPKNPIETAVNAFTADLSWDVVTEATEYILKYKRNLDASWTFVNLSANSHTLTGLGSNGLYNWQVAALCSSDTSAFTGSSFSTLAAASQTVDACTGKFRDSGGDIGNYFNSENYTYTISPSGATNITITFSAFNVETDYDYLYIYDGPNTSYTLIGTYTGTNSPGVITSSGGSITMKFTSDGSTVKSGWDASWNCSIDNSDNIPPTTAISAPANWITSDFSTSFSDNDNIGVEKSFYAVYDNSGAEWRANNTRGFFYDNFSTIIHPDWTISTGTWSISNGTLFQSDEVLSNTNIYAPLTQNLSNRYVYHWKGKIDGTGTNKRAGFHYFCDNGSLPNRGNSYFVWFRVDNQKLQFYKVANDTFSLVQETPFTFNANQWYDFKVIYDRVTGKTNVYVDNIFADSWTDSSPYSNGSFVSFRSGNAQWYVDDFEVMRSRASSVNVTVGAAGTNDIRYQNPSPLLPSGSIGSMVKDSSDNLSAIVYQNLNIDWSPPIDVILNDGMGADINTSYSLTSLSANWNASSDIHSGVTKYWYAIGTSQGGTDITGWADNGLNTDVTRSGLLLTQGQTYYFSAMAENGAGLFSGIASSDGQTVYLPPMADFTAINDTLCSGDSISFINNSQNATSYNWTFTGGSPASATVAAPVVTYSSSAIYDVTLIATGPGGTDTLIKTAYVTVKTTPTATVMANQSICEGETVTLTSSGGVTYQWNTGDVTSSISVSPALTTTYNVVATTDGCKSSPAYSTVTVNPAPVISFTVDTTQLTLPDSAVSFTDNTPGGTLWSWSFQEGNPSGSVIQNPTVYYSTAGSYNVVLYVTDSNGCYDSLAKNAYIVVSDPLSKPIANFTSNITSGCEALEVGFSDASANNPTGWKWLFQGGLPSDDTIQNPSVNYSSPGSYDVTLIATNSFGSDTLTLYNYITVNAIPTISVSSDTTICNGDAVELNASGGSSYSWNTGQSVAYLVVLPSLNTTYVVTTSSNGCTSVPDSIIVNVNPVPTATISPGQEVCQGSTAAINATGGSAYLWNTGDTTAAINVTPFSTITYSVIAITNGCESTPVSSKITVNPVPSVTLTPDTSICEGQSVMLVATGGDSYLWNTGSASSSIIISPSVTTAYSVTAASNGCTSAVGYVNVNVTPAPNTSITSDQTICFGDSVILTAFGGDTYQWNTGDSTASITVSPVTYSTTYSVSIEKAGCKNASSKSTSVFVVTLPVADFIVSDSTLYLPDAFATFTNNSSSSDGYFWDFGDGGFSTDQNPWHLYGTAGAYSVTLIATSASCANDTLVMDSVIKVQIKTGTGSMVKEMSMAAVFPNPFAQQTVIRYGLEKRQRVSIELTDITSRLIFSNNEEQDAGIHQFVLSADKLQMCEGIYLLKIITNETGVWSKLIVGR